MDGKLYTVGGRNDVDGSLRSVECFDPSTGQWSAVTDMSTALKDHGVAVVEGKLCVVGGKDNTGTHVSSVACFDPSTGQWSGGVAMSTARCGLAVVSLECPVD